MTDQELTTVVSSILRSHVPDVGFQGVDVTSGLGWAGDPVIQAEPLARGEDSSVLRENEVEEERDLGEDIACR